MLDELGYIAGQEKNGTDSSAIMARDRTAAEEEEGEKRRNGKPKENSFLKKLVHVA